jgi:hypothetical protein
VSRSCCHCVTTVKKMGYLDVLYWYCRAVAIQNIEKKGLRGTLGFLLKRFLASPPFGALG